MNTGGQLATIGLIGGLSWESTATYYATLNTMTSSVLGTWKQPPLLIASVDFADFVQRQAAGEWESMGEELAAIAASMTAAGATVIGIGANTMHLVVDQVRNAAAPAELVSVIDALGACVSADGVRRVGLLGTRYVTELGFFAEGLASHGLDVVIPEIDDRAVLNRIIYDEITQGALLASSRAEMVSIIERLVARGCTAVALACTEFSLLMRPGDSPVPTYDTTEIHCAALLRAAGLAI